MQLSGPLSSTLMMVPSGKDGIIDTLRVMRSMVKKGRRDMQVRVTALSLVENLPPKAWAQEIYALFYFVRDQIRFVRDINEVETLHTPEKTLEIGQGDCDDKVILLASLLESIGHPARFVAVGFRPDEYEHVYVETKLGNQWLPLETTEPVEPGWNPSGIRSKLVMFV